MKENNLKNADKQPVRRARITNLVLATTIVFAMLMFVYACIQKREADKARADAEATMRQLRQVEQEAMQANEEAEKQRMFSIAAEHHALQALEACQQSKRK